MTLEMLVGKGHLEEVDPKELHEEEDAEEGWEDSSNVGEDIDESEVPPVNFPGYRWPLEPNYLIRPILIPFYPILDGLVADWGSLLCLRHDRQNRTLSIENMLINKNLWLNEGRVCEMNVGLIKVEFEGVDIVLRIYYWISLVYRYITTSICFASAVALEFQVEWFLHVSDVVMTAYLVCLVQRQAQPFVDP